jgi:hypothetical protein
MHGSCTARPADHEAIVDGRIFAVCSTCLPAKPTAVAS